MSQHAIVEANRCLKCKKPLCVQGCPVSTNIPEMARLILSDDILSAGKMLFENNPLSVICALICPHENQCEGHCILNRKGQPIHVSSMEHYVSDYYLTRMQPTEVEGKKHRVAIIGSGPSGITLAYLLALKGYPVTLFDNHDKIGGVLRYGIPEFRLPKTILDRIKEKLELLGVVIRPNTLIGPNISLDDLLEDGYDAVFVGTGVWKPNRLKIKGETRGDVHFAVDYLKNPEVYNLGSNVIIIGGGNVAMDVARTSLRRGCENVTILYRKDEQSLPALNEEIRYAKLDGVQFEFFKSPLAIKDVGVEYEETAYETIDETKVWSTTGNRGIIPASSVIIAASQGPQTNIVMSSKGIETHPSGLVITDECGRTTKEGVFAAGDVVTGAKTVVEAVKYAKLSAEAIIDYLENRA